MVGIPASLYFFHTYQLCSYLEIIATSWLGRVFSCSYPNSMIRSHQSVSLSTAPSFCCGVASCVVWSCKSA